MKGLSGALVVSSALMVLGPSAAAAQERPGTPATGDLAPSVRDVAVVPDTVSLGDPFALRITVALPPGGVAFLPDSLEGNGFAPLAPLSWSVADDAAGRLLTVEYAMIAFDVGAVSLPDFEVFTAAGSDSEAAGLSAPGSAVGSWNALREVEAGLPSLRLHPVPEQPLQVASVLLLDENTNSVQPRPMADVVGGDRNWPATLLFVFFGLTLGTVLTVAARDFVTGAHGRVPGPAGARARALSELDIVLADGPHRRGDPRAFYERSSEIVREFAETFDPLWDRAWTTTELMKGLRGRRPDPGTATLSSSMLEAEAVKFGGVRPDVEEAETYWRVLRDWVADSTDGAAPDDVAWDDAARVGPRTDPPAGEGP